MTVNITSLNDLPNIYNQQYTKEVSDSIQRLDTGLKINDTADDTAAAVISTSLRANASSLLQGVENANSGLALVEVSNKALTFQEEILNKIKDRLELAQSSDASTRDNLLTNIKSLINDFDEIASSTSYNDKYTLQQSSSDTSSSSSYSISFTNSTNVNTPSIHSNSEGVNLTTLKELSSGRLTLDEVSSQLQNIDTALSTVDSYKDEFTTTKEELGINVSNLLSIEEGNKKSEQLLTQADTTTEENILSGYNLLVESSKFAITQANITQQAVLDLLTTIPEYEPVVKENTVEDKEDFVSKKDESFNFNNSNDTKTTTSTPSSSTNIET